MRQLADELRAETGKEQRISGDEGDPVTGNLVEEVAVEVGEEQKAVDEEKDETEDEEEEEDPGYNNSEDDDEDNDSPPTSSHRPVT